MVRHNACEIARGAQASDGAVEYALWQRDVCGCAGKHLVSLQRCGAEARSSFRLDQAGRWQRSGNRMAGLSHDRRVAATHKPENRVDAKLQHKSFPADE